MEAILWSVVLLWIVVELISLLRKFRPRRAFAAPIDGGKLISMQKSVPSPTSRLPIIGHLHLLQGNAVIRMTELSKEYGHIYSLQLGSVEAVVVSSLQLIKLILIDKDFGNRPNFLRYNILFGKDKENSLAFCDWSYLQKTRRALARQFCHTGKYADRLDRAMCRAGDLLVSNITMDMNNHAAPYQFLKSRVQKTCATVFLDFFCSEFCSDWDSDSELDEVVRLFDEIFWEINQGHPTDVLPYTAMLYKNHLDNLANMGVRIRQFVVKRIIVPHLSRLDPDNLEDFVDVMLSNLDEARKEDRLTMDQVLYELEDFIGGHSAVSNLLCRALVEIGAVPGLSEKIYQKIFTDNDKNYMHALVYETLRRTSSPIVPHVASMDKSVEGYPIKKGTVVLINNYELNTSEVYWTEPDKFMPERFLIEDGSFRKPANFFPFSYGKRACMGYQLVEKVTESILISILKHFDIESMEQPTQLPVASVAIHPNEQLRLKLIPRH